jgi:hypothetical protein
MRYKTGNVFTIQIDTTGATTFTNPITIGTLNSTSAGTIHAYIPKSLGDVSYGYFRIVSSNPATTAGDLSYVYVNPRPMPDISVDSIFRCANGAGVDVTVYEDNPLGGGWGYSYQWSPTSGLSGPGSSTTTVYPSVSTNYTVSSTDIDNQCVGTDLLHAISWPTPVLFVGNDTIICKGTSLQLHATGQYIATYSWTPATTLQNPTTANPIATPTAVTTNYLCQVTSSHGCTQNDNISVSTITVNTDAGLASINTCLGGAVQLTGTSSGTQFRWHPAAGLSDTTISNPVANPTTTTKYYLTGKELNFGCSKKDSITINVGAIVVNVPDIAITCANSGTLTASPVGTYVTPLTYVWTPSAGLSGTTGATVTANPINTRTYYVAMTTANGCSGSDSARVTVNAPNYSVNFSATQQLLTYPNFTAQFSNLTPNMANYNFTWYFGDGTSVQSNNGTVFHTYTFNGNFDVKLVAVSIATGCTDFKLQTGYMFTTGGTSCLLTSTVFTPQGTSKCVGDSILLTCNTGSNYTYQWNLNGSPISSATQSTYEAKVSGNYSVSIFDQTCTVISQQKTLSFATPPAIPVITPTGIINLCGGGSVFLNASSGYTSYLWNTGASTQNITAYQSGVYTVSVTSGNNNCVSSSSYSLNASALPSPGICMVTVDSVTGKNMIIWNRPVSQQIDSFLIYREGIVAFQYDKIGHNAYSIYSTFVDNNSNPQQQSYSYKIALKDTCGVVSLLSDYHKTIHLTISQGIGSTWNLIWNHYEGFTYGTYDIYRGTSPTNMTWLTSLASTNNSYTDFSPPPGLVYYRIEIENPSGCSPSKTLTPARSRSNRVDNGDLITGLQETSGDFRFNLYPNPAGDKINLQFGNENMFNENYLITICDLSGRQLISSSKQADTGQIITIETNSLAAGVYLVKVNTANAQAVKRLVIAR